MERRPPSTADRVHALDRRAFLRGTGSLLVAGSLGGAILSACEVAEDRGDVPGTAGAGGTAGGAASGTLDVRIVDDIRNLDPAFMPGTVDDAVMLNVAENLVTFRPGTTELVNELAEEFTSSDDGLEHEFRLKEGIQFHGGYGEMTAEDVKFSFERIAGLTDPPIDATYKQDWGPLQEVEVTGTYTGVIRLSEPFAPLMATTIPGHAGMVISRAAWEELGEDIANQPIGSGPYEFVEWERGQRVALQRFEDWSGAALEWAEEEPQWDRIVFRPISEDSSADIAIESGEIQFGPVSHGSVARFEDAEGFTITRQPTYDYAWIGFNVTDEALSDVDVRRGLRLALDVDSMIQAAFEGRTVRANTLISPDMPIGHWAEAPPYDQNLEEARAILDEAGVDGLSLEFSIIEEPGSQVIAEIAQANLSEVGVDVSIRLRESAELLEQVDQLQMFYVSLSNSADPSWATYWFTTEQVGAWNFQSWSNEEFDQLHEAALSERDEERRHEMYVQMQQLMDEDAIARWVMYRTHHYAHPPDLDPSMLTARYGKYRAWDHRIQ